MKSMIDTSRYSRNKVYRFMSLLDPSDDLSETYSSDIIIDSDISDYPILVQSGASRINTFDSVISYESNGLLKSGTPIDYNVVKNYYLDWMIEEYRGFAYVNNELIDENGELSDMYLVIHPVRSVIPTDISISINQITSYQEVSDIVGGPTNLVECPVTEEGQCIIELSDYKLFSVEVRYPDNNTEMIYVINSGTGSGASISIRAKSDKNRSSYLLHGFIEWLSLVIKQKGVL